jgi:hypothetical protein
VAISPNTRFSREGVADAGKARVRWATVLNGEVTAGAAATRSRLLSAAACSQAGSVRPYRRKSCVADPFHYLTELQRHVTQLARPSEGCPGTCHETPARGPHRRGFRIGTGATLRWGLINLTAHLHFVTTTTRHSSCKPEASALIGASGCKCRMISNGPSARLLRIERGVGPSQA